MHTVTSCSFLARRRRSAASSVRLAASVLASSLRSASASAVAAASPAANACRAASRSASIWRSDAPHLWERSTINRDKKLNRASICTVGGQHFREVAPQCIYSLVRESLARLKRPASLPYASAAVYTQNGSAAGAPFNVVGLIQHC